MFVNFNILNQLGSPAINSNTFANRPAAGQTGRLFVSTDTYEIYRDNGTTWDLIGGPGSSTITGTGTATQVAYFTSSQAIGSSANLYWDNTAGALGINTATPGAELDVHGTGTIAQFNTTSATGNTYIAFQRTGTGLWRIGDTYNAGNNFFELHNTVLGTDALEFEAATNKSAFQAQQTYTTGLARGNYFDYNLSVAAGGSFSSPNSITALGASLDLTLAGNATIPSGARSGLDAYNSIAFTGAGTLTHNQGTQIRAYSNLTAGWAFNGSAVGTITHLAGLRALFPDNSGSAVNVTNNYALLLNDQTANTGTVTYTNRWGVYQEGTSDLNYMAANLLLGSTTNNGNKLQITGNSSITGNLGIGISTPQTSLHISSTLPILSFSDTDSFFDPLDRFIIRGGASNQGNIQWFSNSTGITTNIMSFFSNGNATIGTVNYAKLTTVVSGTFTTGGNDNDYSTYGLWIADQNPTNAVGGAIGFGSSTGRKLAAIAAYHEADQDQVGLKFYVQPTTTGSAATLTEALYLKSQGQLRFVPLAANPSNAQAGDVYYNSAVNKLRLYDGTNWVDLN